MQAAFALVAMALTGFSFGAQHGTAAEKAARPGVVYMQRSSKFVVPFSEKSYAYTKAPLWRELQRQAFLIAARDQLGLATRDEYLGDWIPSEGDNAPFEMVIYHSKPTALRVVHGFKSGKTKTVCTVKPEIALLPTKDVLGVQYDNILDYRPWFFQAEELSRGEYVETLKKAGFTGEANQWKADGDVPEEINQLLDAMTFTKQFDAVRRLHELIRRDGESPARLGALIRGYANLGVLTEFYWNPAHKVFKARALLYAQRFLARDAQSPTALWHRAYAYGLTGLHKFALDDLQAADKLIGEMKEADRPARPEWGDLIDAYCRFDARSLKNWSGDGYLELADFLRFCTARMSGEPSMKVEVAGEISPNMPECYPMHDGVCAYYGVSTGHRATTTWLIVAGSTLYSRLRDMPGLPRQVAEITSEMDADDAGNDTREEFKVRAKLIRALMDADKPPHNEKGGPQATAKPIDSGEPSWAALGLLIRELSFVQVLRRVYFECIMLDVSPKEFIEASVPLIANHPYASYIDTFTLNKEEKNAAWKKVKFEHPGDFERQQYDMYAIYYRDYHPDTKNRRKMLIRIYSTQMDQTAQDMSLEMEQFDSPGQNPLTFGRAVSCLLVISPYSPYARAMAWIQFGDNFADKLPEWEKTADQNPRLCKGLASKYLKEERWEDAAKWAKAAFELCPNKKCAMLLATAYWRQGKHDQWVSALEKVLNYPDYGLEHAGICESISRYYMRQKDWEKSLKYAEAAAETYSAWGLEAAADCYEGMHKWEESEKLRIAIGERYHNSWLDWYYFCRRTGHGDLDAARKRGMEYVNSDYYQKTYPKEAAVFNILEKEPRKAADKLADFFQKVACIRVGLRLVVLHDELGDAAARDKILQTLLTSNYTPSKTFNKEARDALVGLAKLIDADLKAGGKGNIDLAEADRLYRAMEKTADDLPDAENDVNMSLYGYILGRYLALHGKSEEAAKYLKLCLAETEKLYTVDRTLAGVALRELGIKPEDCKELWEKKD
ncbi:MAG: hypothetical protein JW959_05140 [Pirellulales bacterium]|nr:hypothetical protein [Pirellulales bacterium]